MLNKRLLAIAGTFILSAGMLIPGCSIADIAAVSEDEDQTQLEKDNADTAAENDAEESEDEAEDPSESSLCDAEEAAKSANETEAENDVDTDDNADVTASRGVGQPSTSPAASQVDNSLLEIADRAEEMGYTLNCDAITLDDTIFDTGFTAEMERNGITDNYIVIIMGEDEFSQYSSELYDEFIDSGNEYDSMVDDGTKILMRNESGDYVEYNRETGLCSLRFKS